jgi:hypothetical protein
MTDTVHPSIEERRAALRQKGIGHLPPDLLVAKMIWNDFLPTKGQVIIEALTGFASTIAR